MQRSFPLSTSLRQQLLIGLGVAIWTVLFLILLAPFDISDLSTQYKFLLLPTYGLLFMISYLLSLLLQKRLYQHYGKWQVWMELLFLFLFLSICFLLSTLYYRSPIMNGEMSVPAFLQRQYIPIAIIISPLLLILRWVTGRYFLRKQANKPQLLVFRGSLQKDVLQVPLEKVLFLKAADNYIEIYYRRQGETEQHLLRSTLKQASQTAPQLVRTHRSYLINPRHFEHWIGNKEISVAGRRIPVSKTYKARLKEVLASTTNN